MYTAIDVSLEVYGYHPDGSVVTLCPEHDSTLVIHCTVTESPSLQWWLEPLLFETVTFTTRSALYGPIDRSPFAFILTNIETTASSINNTFESQLIASTYELREVIKTHGSPLEIHCQASPTVQENVTITNSGKILIPTSGKSSCLATLVCTRGVW